MFVNRIVKDNWIGVRSNEDAHECEDVEEIAAAIKMLNGRNKTEVHIESRADKRLTVAGEYGSLPAQLRGDLAELFSGACVPEAQVPRPPQRRERLAVRSKR